MGKNDKVETEVKQRVDEELQRRGDELYKMALSLANVDYQPNRAPQYAAFTPGQNAAFQAQNQAAGAFGMPQAAGTGMPTPEISAGGIAGYSTGAGYDEAVGLLPPEYFQQRQGFLDLLNAEYQGQINPEEDEKKKASSGPNYFEDREKDEMHLYRA